MALRVSGSSSCKVGPSVVPDLAPPPLDPLAARDEAIARIARREAVPSEVLLAALGAAAPRARAEAHLALARAYAAAGAPDRAATHAERARLVGGSSPEVLEACIDVARGLGDAAGVRAARKRAALLAVRAGDVDAALRWLDAWQYTDAELHGEDRYAYDPDVLDAVAALAGPHRRPLEAPPPLEGRRLRVAHLAFGAAHFNSVIFRITRVFARHHARERFEMAVFVPETRAELDASKQGAAHLAYLAEQGCRADLAPDAPLVRDRLLALAESIRAFAPDLLVVNAALAEFRQLFLCELRPAPAILGFVSGPPPQFAPPMLDAGIAWTWHPLVDAPIPCAHVPLETILPDASEVRLCPRAALGVPDDAVLLGAAGRGIKHRSAAHWARIAEVLRRFPAAHFLCLGADEAALTAEAAGAVAEVRERVHFEPWMERYLEVFGQVDVVVDTFPSGGGVVLSDVMALGRPVLTFENDYGQLYDQADWRPAQEFMPACELVVPRGDEAGFQQVAGRLVADAAYRAAMGARCRATVLDRLGQPERMVRRCEDVFEDVVRRKLAGR